MSVIADAKAGLHSIKTDPSKEDVLEKLAQAGYLTKGALYIVIGFLTVRAAIGFGGEIAGSKDAIKFIAGQPMGRVLLILMAFGLFSYGAWRYAKAYLARVKNKSSKDKVKSVMKKIGFAISATSYTSLGVFVVLLLSGNSSGGSGGGSSVTGFLNDAMSTAWGPILMGLIGFGVLIAALMQFKHALKPELKEQIDTTELDAKTQRVVIYFYQAGSLARGVIFGLISYYLMHSAYQATGTSVDSSKDALRQIFSMSYGSTLLAIVASGLFVYGVACMVKGRYRSVSALDLR